jgi:hypothetical protein
MFSIVTADEDDASFAVDREGFDYCYPRWCVAIAQPFEHGRSPHSECRSEKQYVDVPQTCRSRRCSSEGRQRENIFAHVLETAGVQPLAKITTAVIMAGRDRRANTPYQARHFLDAMRGLFRWAVKARLIKIDPTAGVEQSASTSKRRFRALVGRGHRHL